MNKKMLLSFLLSTAYLTHASPDCYGEPTPTKEKVTKCTSQHCLEQEATLTTIQTNLAELQRQFTSTQIDLKASRQRECDLDAQVSELKTRTTSWKRHIPGAIGGAVVGAVMLIALRGHA